jgi:hypothetical protein
MSNIGRNSQPGTWGLFHEKGEISNGSGRQQSIFNQNVGDKKQSLVSVMENSQTGGQIPFVVDLSVHYYIDAQNSFDEL